MIDILYSALHAKYGIVVQSDADDVEDLRQALYQTRRKLQDEALADLIIHTSRTNEAQLWIRKRRPADAT